MSAPVSQKKPEPPPSALRRRSVGSPVSRSLLLTVLGEYVMPRGGRVWQESLVDGLVALGHTGQTARQAVARSKRDGWLEGERFGRRTRMTITPPTRRMLDEGRGRIFGFGDDVVWDGRWLVVVVRLPEDQRRVRHHVRTGLSRAGRARWAAASGSDLTSIASSSSHRRSARPASSRERSCSGADAGTIGVTEDVVGAWDLAVLAQEYDAFAARFQSARPQDSATAYRAQTELVHAWRRFAFLNPNLPRQLLPADWPRSRAHRLFQRCHQTWAERAQAYFAALEDLRAHAA